MNRERVLIILNSTVTFILAFLVTTVIHELAHAFVGISLGSGAILHHNYVEHPLISSLSTHDRIMVSLAGPLASLIQGIVLTWGYPKYRNVSYPKLFLLWVCILGFINFFGYLMTGPLFNSGDIGKIYELLNFPLKYQIVMAILGLLMLIVIAYKLSIPFLEFSYKKEWVSDSSSRNNFAFNIIILPWLIGSTIVTILYLPVVALVSIIYPFSSGMIFILPWKNARRITSVKISENSAIGKSSFLLYSSLIISIIIFKFILAYGIKL
jgi:hypothetical protein